MLLEVGFGPGTSWGWFCLRLGWRCWLLLWLCVVGHDVVKVVLQDLWKLIEREVVADFVDDWIEGKGWVSCQ